VILTAIVRRWSETEVAIYKSAAVRGGAKKHIEHVVPVRVIVDRMIRQPRSVDRLLRTCVVLAEVTPEEHHRIGTLVTTHAELYEQMRACPLDDLVHRGWRRYARRKISVFDDRGRQPQRRRVRPRT
jgi:hypothetical protein